MNKISEAFIISYIRENYSDIKIQKNSSICEDTYCTKITFGVKKLFTTKINVYIIDLVDNCQLQYIIKYFENNKNSNELNLVVCLTTLYIENNKCLYICENVKSIIHFLYINTQNNLPTYYTDFYYNSSKHIKSLINGIVKELSVGSCNTENGPKPLKKS